jgi:hypothetical protein
LFQRFLNHNAFFFLNKIGLSCIPAKIWNLLLVISHKTHKMCSTIHQHVAAYQIFAHPEHDYIIQIHILS